MDEARLPASIRSYLRQDLGAFLFGHTAPDVQVVSGQPRQDTHFFDLPICAGDPPAWERLLAAYPPLSQAEKLPVGQAIFLAGYLCHLQADWLWIQQVFAPVFGPGCNWGSVPHRLYLHNVLRAYLDRMLLPSLLNGRASAFGQAAPASWLPFVADRHLCDWQEYLAGQLQPGAVVQTVELFAARQGIPTVEFDRLLSSEQRLDELIFVRLPRQHLARYRQALIEANIQLLQGYLGWIG